MECYQENLTCDSITGQTIHMHKCGEDYLRAFLFQIASLLCPSQPTIFPSNPPCLTADMTSGPQSFLRACHEDKTVKISVKTEIKVIWGAGCTWENTAI